MLGMCSSTLVQFTLYCEHLVLLGKSQFRGMSGLLGRIASDDDDVNSVFNAQSVCAPVHFHRSSKHTLAVQFAGTKRTNTNFSFRFDQRSALLKVGSLLLLLLLLLRPPCCVPVVIVVVFRIVRNFAPAPLSSSMHETMLLLLPPLATTAGASRYLVGQDLWAVAFGCGCCVNCPLEDLCYPVG